MNDNTNDNVEQQQQQRPPPPPPPSLKKPVGYMETEAMLVLDSVEEDEGEMEDVAIEEVLNTRRKYTLQFIIILL